MLITYICQECHGLTNAGAGTGYPICSHCCGYNVSKDAGDL